MPDNFYRFKNKTNSTVGQLNSTLGNGGERAALHLPAHPRPPRHEPGRRAAVPRRSLVDLSDGQVRAGRENFSTANELDQDVFELTDDFTMLRGKHTFTFGTHNEFFSFRNLFIRDNFGSYRLREPRLARAGPRAAVRLQLLADGRPDAVGHVPGAAVRLLRRRQWRAATNLTLTYGVRVDIPTFPDKPTANPSSKSSSATAPTRCPAVSCCRHGSASTTPCRQRHPAGARWHRPLLGPHAVRLAVEPVRQHRHRVPPPVASPLQRRQPHHVRPRSERHSRRRSATPRPTKST